VSAPCPVIDDDPVEYVGRNVGTVCEDMGIVVRLHRFESLRYHRAMLCRRTFGRIGWFALPTFWIFEYFGPLVELCGYVLMLFLVAAERLLGYRFLDYDYLWAFLLASLGYGMLVNVLAVLVGAWRFRLGLADQLQRGLVSFSGRRDVLVLLLYAVLENVGYRQLTLYWRMRGLWDAWRGKTGWEKFARVGFREGTAPAHG